MTATIKTTTNDFDNAATKPRRLKIACCSSPNSGHLNPVLSLAEGLAESNTANKSGDGDDNDSYGENEVCLVTLPHGAEKAKSRCEAAGIKLVALSVGKGFDSDESMKATAGKCKKGVFRALADVAKDPIKEALDEFCPDVVVGDMFGFAAQEYAASRNIPLVINLPGNFIVLQYFLGSVINVDDRSFWISAGGLFVSYTSLNMFRVLWWFNVMDFGVMADRIRGFVNCGNSLVLVNSFWGFEKPQYLLHPNIFPVGSVDKPPPKKPDFSKSHPDLHSFLKNAQASNRKIFMVTTGSMVRMEEWMVRLLWEAFERLSREYETSIVWSLREDRQKFLSEEELQHPAFHFSKWLPQPALMASDLVDGVLTHCGWNGTLETVSGGKPVVVLPFFADQMANAGLLINAGCATAVTAMPLMNDDVTGMSSYAGPDAGFWKRLKLCTLTVDGVVEGCARLLTDPKYKANAKKLQALSSGPGMGRSFACQLIEHAGKHGLRHLTESGGEGSEDEPRAATLANRLTGHRPLAMTILFCVLCFRFCWSDGGNSIRQTYHMD